MNWIKKIFFYLITLSPVFLISYFSLIMLLSYTWYSNDKYWKGFTPSNSVEHAINQVGIKTLSTPYIMTRNIWQAQENCVQLDKALIYKPSNSGNCTFKNIEFDVKIDHINGIRIQNHTNKQKESNLKRVLVLGDSHAMGWGVENNETFSALLDAHFNNVIFENMAVSGYGTPRELIVAQNALKAGKKYDLILLQYCDNDISEIEYFFKNKNLDKSYIIPIKEGLTLDTIKKNFFVRYMKNIFDIALRPLSYLNKSYRKQELTDPVAHKGMLASTLNNFLSNNVFPEIIVFPVNGTVEDTTHLTSYLHNEILMLNKKQQSLIHVIDLI